MSYEQVFEDILEQGKRDVDTRVETALRVLLDYGQTDGAHHKAWVIDQAVRALAGVHYKELITEYKHVATSEDMYYWDVGISP
jgi:hypothetical protein